MIPNKSFDSAETNVERQHVAVWLAGCRSKCTLYREPRSRSHLVQDHRAINSNFHLIVLKFYCFIFCFAASNKSEWVYQEIKWLIEWSVSVPNNSKYSKVSVLWIGWKFVCSFVDRMRPADSVVKRLYSLQARVDELLEEKKVLEQKLSRSHNEMAILQNRLKTYEQQYSIGSHQYHHQQYQMVSKWICIT